MGIGIRLGLTGQRVNASPASLFTVAGSRGFMFDLSNYATQWQDTGATVPITSTAQSVARVDDLSGLGNHATQATAGSRAATVVFPASGVRNLANGSADVGNNVIWQTNVTQSGVTASKVASGFDTDGLPYVDYRYQGTATGTNHDQIFNVDVFKILNASGFTATASIIAKVVSGSLAGVSGLRIRVAEFDSSFNFIRIALSGFVTSSTDTSASATQSISTGNQLVPSVALTFNNGAAIDVTYRIKALQFELGASRTNYQFNYSAFNVTEPGFASIRGIQFDGVDDWLSTAAIDFSNSDEVTVVAGVRKLSDAALNATVVEIGNVNVSAVGTFTIAAPGGNAGSYGIGSRGTSSAGTSSTLNSAPAPDTAVLTGQGKISTDTGTLRRNGTQIASAVADQGTGNFANAIVYIGRRGGTSLPFNGVLTFLFAINRLLTANELASVEAYANARTGAY